MENSRGDGRGKARGRAVQEPRNGELEAEARRPSSGNANRERERSNEGEAGRSFAQLSQEDSDAALARAMQEQFLAEEAEARKSEREKSNEGNQEDADAAFARALQEQFLAEEAEARNNEGNQEDADAALARTIQEQFLAEEAEARNRNRERERSNEARGGRSFAQLSQEDADAALARTLQEQFVAEDLLARQRRYGELPRPANSRIDAPRPVLDENQLQSNPPDVSESESEGEDEEQRPNSSPVRLQQPQLPPQNRAQGAEGGEQDYEFLTALGDLAGRQSTGLSKDITALLPTFLYDSRSQEKLGEDSVQCLICYEHYSDGELLISFLPCKHIYHQHCATTWLEDNKICPKCMEHIFG